MKRVVFACLLAVAAAWGPLQLAAAEIAKLRYLTSAYSDEKGGGLNLPEGVACDGKGRVVVADTGNGRLLRFTFQDKAFTGGSEIKIPQMPEPSIVRLSSTGEIYVLDNAQRRIVRLGSDGGFKATLAFSGVPAPATIVPKSFTIDAADNLYVLDVFSSRILVLNAQGAFQKALPLPGDAGFISDVAVDTAGTVFVLDAIKRRLFSAAKDAASFTALGGDLGDSITTLPTYMTTDKGIIFVVEGEGGSIVTFGRDGSFLARQLTKGWEEGSLNHPAQICITDKDEVFVADRDNSRIQVFRLVR
jgi:DNA-binding beta-propeller fold protein YncE